METTLSVFFGTDRTYVGMIGQGEKGVELHYVNTVPSVLKGENDYLDVLMELEAFLPPIAAEAKRLQMCIPAENVFVHQFPAVARNNVDQLKALLQFEIKQAYPLHTFDDFSTTVYPLVPRLDGKEMMIAVMIDKKYLMACEFVLGVAAIPLDRTGISQFAAHGALLYNYPEHAENTVALFTVQESFMDVSILKKGKLAYYNLISLPRHEDLGAVCNAEIEKLLAGQYVSFIDEAFMLGSGLTQADLAAASKVLSIPVRRFNTFRMMTTKLSQRDREYCARTAHLYPPCIGAALPDIHAGEEIRLN